MFLIVPQLRPKRRGVSGAGWGPRRWRRTVEDRRWLLDVSRPS